MGGWELIWFLIMKEALFETPNFQPADYLRKYVENNREWPYAELVNRIYPVVETIKQRFYDGVFTPWQLERLPVPPIAIEDMRNWKTLATYRLIEDGYGFNDKLTLNEAHLKQIDGIWAWDYGGDWGLYETITHEVCHEWYRRRIDSGHDKHDPVFTGKLSELGIHCNKKGQHTQLADEDKPFGILMKEWLVQKPEEIEPGTVYPFDWWRDGKDKKGGSTLKKWCCPECGLKVRMGIAGDPKLRHHTCEEAAGHPVFLIPGDVYVAKKL